VPEFEAIPVLVDTFPLVERPMIRWKDSNFRRYDVLNRSVCACGHGSSFHRYFKGIDGNYVDGGLYEGPCIGETGKCEINCHHYATDNLEWLRFNRGKV